MHATCFQAATDPKNDTFLMFDGETMFIQNIDGCIVVVVLVVGAVSDLV